MESSQRFMCENKLCYGNQNQLCTISVIDFDKESIGKNMIGWFHYNVPYIIVYIIYVPNVMLIENVQVYS